MQSGFDTGFLGSKEMFRRGNVDLWWRRVVRVTYKDVERNNGPRPSPGWICSEEVSGIVGITATTRGYIASILRRMGQETRIQRT